MTPDQPAEPVPTVPQPYPTPYAQAPPTPYGPGTYVITKPGGLSGAAHAVHILICFLTCGLWIPGYIAFLMAAPAQRQEVIAPYGTPLPGPIQGLPRPLPPNVNPPMTPEQIRASNRRIVLALVVVFGGIAVFVAVVLILNQISGV